MPRKFYILFYLFTSISFISFSQVEIRLSTGLSFSHQISTYESPNSSYRNKFYNVVGYSIGLKSKINFSKKIVFLPQLQVIKKGSKFYTPGSGKNVEQLYYLESLLPLGYRATLKKYSIYFGAGPSIAYGLSGKYQADLQPDYNPFNYYTKKFDAGAMLQIAIQKGRFEISTLYNHGFYDIYKESQTPSQDSKSFVGNRTFQLVGTYYFTVK